MFILVCIRQDLSNGCRCFCFEGLYVVAARESLVDRVQNESQQRDQHFRRIQDAHAELQAELEVLVDSIEGVRRGIINLGDYSQFRELTPGEQQHMYTLERANLVASRTMGMQQYVQSIREANRGVVHCGQDTNAGMAEEGGESEGEPTNAPEVSLAPNHGDFSQVLETMRNELNDCLRRESWTEAWQLQNGCLLLLDVSNR